MSPLTPLRPPPRKSERAFTQQFGNGMRIPRIQLRHIRAAVCALLIAVSSGCAAIGTRVIHREPFAGVKTDYAMCFHREGISSECRIHPIVAIVDSPFSLIADVLFLPFDLGHDAGHSLWNPPKTEPGTETPGTGSPNKPDSRDRRSAAP